jgi:hypothetical protein
MPPQRIRSRVRSTVGGIMTKEAGAVTGDLDVETTVVGKGIDVRVAYAGADEWYTALGSPLPPGTSDLRHLHQQVVSRLTTPGPVEHGNERPVDLVGFRA